MLIVTLDNSMQKEDCPCIKLFSATINVKQ